MRKKKRKEKELYSIKPRPWLPTWPSERSNSIAAGTSSDGQVFLDGNERPGNVPSDIREAFASRKGLDLALPVNFDWVLQ